MYGIAPNLLELDLFGIFVANPWFIELANQTFHYQGRHALTEGGLVCQRWDAHTPHSHGHTNPDEFPDATIEEAHNYCRGLDEVWPWCYTPLPSVLWRYCGKLELLCCKYKFQRIKMSMLLQMLRNKLSNIYVIRTRIFKKIYCLKQIVQMQNKWFTLPLTSIVSDIWHIGMDKQFHNNFCGNQLLIHALTWTVVYLSLQWKLGNR